MIQRYLIAFARYLFYGVLAGLIVGSTALLFSPAWIREAFFTAHLSPGIQPTGIRFETSRSPQDEIAHVKNHWPAHFNKALYDVPDDELPENLDSSQLITVVDFPKDAWWASSVLHELKKYVRLEPELDGQWFVSGMGQKLVFVPAKTNGKIWEAGKRYQVALDKNLHVKSLKHWLQLDSFKFGFEVPPCLIRISHQVQAFSRAPLRYEVLFNIESNYPLSTDVVKRSASFRSSLHSVADQPKLLSSQDGGLGNLKIQLKSDPIAPLAIDEVLASLPPGDYTSGVICASPALSDRVPASELQSEIKIVRAAVTLERAASEFWPQYILHLDFSQPVSINDVQKHLHLNSPSALAVEIPPNAENFSRVHRLVIRATDYDAAPIAIEFIEGAWGETGIQAATLAANPPRWQEPLQLPPLDSLCMNSRKPIFQFENSQGLTAAQILACGNSDANSFVVSGLQVWKFVNKKESPAIRIVGGDKEATDNASSIVCFDKSKDKIAIASVDENELKLLSTTGQSAANTAAFAKWPARPGFICDRLKPDCFAQTIDLIQFCDAPVSDHP